jgi:branched-chain amino acid transport system permease protein
MTAETIIQSLASGLLMGLLYGLIAVGLALIFGLMDVVNFAHGEFLMIAMYATFFLFAFFALDPLLSAPLVAAALFVFGAVVYLLVVRSRSGRRPMPAWCRFSRPSGSPS